MVYAQPGIRSRKETHKILWDCEIQTDHLISARQPDLEIVNKINIRVYIFVNKSCCPFLPDIQHLGYDTKPSSHGTLETWNALSLPLPLGLL